MGCDIHPVIEAGLYSVMWEAIAVPPRPRDYAFFGYLADVRNGVGEEPVEAHEGIPLDYSGRLYWDIVGFETYDLYDPTPPRDWADRYLSGEHTPRWFTLEEAGGFHFPKDKYAKALWMRWLRYMRFIKQDYGVSEAEVRVVFDFDS